MSTIALLTDFGLDDWYVASVKGVMLSIHPNVNLVDITHQIPPGDVVAGGFVLSQCCRDFPAGTIFVAVVDPGVGTSRKAIAIRALGYMFVGPDNGLFGFLNRMTEMEDREIRVLENTAFHRRQRSATFDGRDIFGPVSAHLSRGVSFGELGPAQPSTTKGIWRQPARIQGTVAGAIIYIDHFGNAFSNIRKSALSLASRQTAYAQVQIKGMELPLLNTFGDVPEGKALAYFGSTGFLEVAVNGDSAAERLRLAVGEPITMVDRAAKGIT